MSTYSRGPAQKRKAGNTINDFKDPKQKVGHSKLKQANATDTSFRSKKIKMPTQGTVAEEAGEEVNVRHMGLDDLLQKVEHYSPAVRKDALWGLRDLFARHAHKLLPNLSKVLEGVLDCSVDVDAEVRAALRTLLESAIAAVPRGAMEPFVPLVIAYIASAMTSMDSSVRLDAILTSNILLERFGDLIGAHLETLLPSYASLLAAKAVGGGGASSITYGALGNHDATDKAKQARMARATDAGQSRAKKAALTAGVSTRVVTALEGLHRLLATVGMARTTTTAASGGAGGGAGGAADASGVGGGARGGDGRRAADRTVWLPGPRNYAHMVARPFSQRHRARGGGDGNGSDAPPPPQKKDPVSSGGGGGVRGGAVGHKGGHIPGQGGCVVETACWSILESSLDLWMELVALPPKHAASAVEWCTLLAEVQLWAVERIALSRPWLRGRPAGADSGFSSASGGTVEKAAKTRGMGFGSKGSKKRKGKSGGKEAKERTVVPEDRVEWDRVVGRVSEVVFSAFPFASFTAMSAAGEADEEEEDVRSGAADKGGKRRKSGGVGGCKSSGRKGKTGGGDGRGNTADSAELVALNVAVARLAGPLIPRVSEAAAATAAVAAAGQGGSARSRRKGGGGAPHIETAILQTVFGYLPRALRGLARSSGGGSGGGWGGRGRSGDEAGEVTVATSGLTTKALLDLLWYAWPHLDSTALAATEEGGSDEEEAGGKSGGRGLLYAALDAFTELMVKAEVGSTAKFECLVFTRRVLVAAVNQSGKGGASMDVEVDDEEGEGRRRTAICVPVDIVGRWLDDLPKLLWMLGAKRLPLTKEILEMLLDLAKRARLPPAIAAAGGLTTAEAVGSCLQRIAGGYSAFFYTQAAVPAAAAGKVAKAGKAGKGGKASKAAGKKGKKGKGKTTASSLAGETKDGAAGESVEGGESKGTVLFARSNGDQETDANCRPAAATASVATIRHVFGPFHQLQSEALQRIALEVVYYLPMLPKALLRALVALCAAPQTTSAIRKYISYILFHRRDDLGTSTYLSVLASILLDSPGASVDGPPDAYAAAAREEARTGMRKAMRNRR